MSTGTATTLAFALEPLDVLFFRDGRPFTGAERSVSGLPLPQTFTGAIRTALLRSVGCDFQALGSAMNDGASFADAVGDASTAEHRWIGNVTVLGPWLGRRAADDDGAEVLLPLPATVHREKKNHKNLHRLSPLPEGQLPGWNPPAGPEELRPLWPKQLAATEPAEGYLTPKGLQQFLRDRDVAADAVIPASELFGLDYRTGLGISPNRLVAEESQIFGRGFLALKKGIFLYGEVLLPDGAPADGCLEDIELLPFGGEGRYVRLRRLDRSFDWPSVVPQGKNENRLLLLTTPCAFAAGWKPKCLDGHIVAAAVPGSLAFSGWDMARRGPKPTQFAVPAGSVYFLDSQPNTATQSLAESDEARLQGWGCFLTGVWTDE